MIALEVLVYAYGGFHTGIAQMFVIVVFTLYGAKYFIDSSRDYCSTYFTLSSTHNPY